MLTLYYFPGSYSMAAHIVLEESGEEFELAHVDLRKGEQRSAAYRKINPLGFVPSLRLDTGELLSENTAILPYLGKRFGLWPTDPIPEARALAYVGYFATSVATAHARALHPDQYSEDPIAHPAIKASGLAAFERHLHTIDELVSGKEWLMENYSACDAYCFGFWTWGLRRSLPMRNLKNYSAFVDRMLQRPAVQRVVENEKLLIA